MKVGSLSDSQIRATIIAAPGIDHPVRCRLSIETEFHKIPPACDTGKIFGHLTIDSFGFSRNSRHSIGLNSSLEFPLINDGVRIINIASGLARFTIPGTSAYGAAKGAVEVLTHYLAKELGPRRIAVNTIAPDAIQTDFSGGMVRDNPEVNKRVAEMTALGHAGGRANENPDEGLGEVSCVSSEFACLRFPTIRKLGQIGHVVPHQYVTESGCWCMLGLADFPRDTEVPSGLRAIWYDFWYD